MDFVEALEGAPAVQPTVLLVEDEVLIRMSLADDLRHEGFNVIEATNADDALEALNSVDEIELVITDVRMPGSMDGIELAVSARQQRPGIKIVVLSGHMSMQDMLAVADRAMQKPARFSEVMAQVKQLLSD